MTFALSLLVVIAVAILTFTVWNWHTMRSMSRTRLSRDLDDAKYLELKYKYEFLIAVVSVVAAAIAAFGYNTIQSVETALKGDFDKKVDSVYSRVAAAAKRSDSLANAFEISINKSINSAQTDLSTVFDYSKKVSGELSKNAQEVDGLNKRLGYLFQNHDRLEKRSREFLTSVDSVRQKIDTINSKNILRQNFYFTQPVPLMVDRSQANDTLYFKNLRTTSGDRLPEFDIRPTIIVISNEGAGTEVTAVTKDYVVLTSNTFYGAKWETSKTLDVILMIKD